MMRSTGVCRGILAAVLAPMLVFASGCHSHHIDVTVENRTGAAIQLLEVDYPSASFGADRLAPGEVFRYSIQVRGKGPLKVEYTGSDGRQEQMSGPTLADHQEGQIQIVLLSRGGAEFHPHLAPQF
jgi:hypothetical protein